MNILVKKSHDIAKEIFADKNTLITEEQYNFLNIYRFLYVEQSIIKKDSNTNTLYFDFGKAFDYLPALCDLALYISQNGLIVLNESNVVIKNYDGYDEFKKEFDSIIWICNKVRDCIAHGEFSISNDLLKIDCNHKDEGNSYALVCDIPLALLERFSPSLHKNLDTFIEKKLTLTHSNTSYPISYIYDDGNSIHKQHINDELNIFNTSYPISYIYDDRNSIYKQHINDELNNFIKNIQDEFEQKIFTSNDDAKKYLEDIKNLILNKKDCIKEHNKFFYRTQVALDDIDSVMEYKKGDEIDSRLFTALFGYMMFTFSFLDNNYRKIDTKERKMKYAGIKAFNLTTDYVKYNSKVNDYEFDSKSECASRVKSIDKRCDNFIKIMSKQIENYKIKPNDRFKESLGRSLDNFIDFILCAYADINYHVITSMRNVCEHANLNIANEKIVGYDASNKNDFSTLNFYYESKPENLLTFIESVNEEDTLEKFSITDFFNELVHYIGSEKTVKAFKVFMNLAKIRYGVYPDPSVSINELDSLLGAKERNINEK